MQYNLGYKIEGVGQALHEIKVVDQKIIWCKSKLFDLKSGSQIDNSKLDKEKFFSVCRKAVKELGLSYSEKQLENSFL